MIPGPHPDVSVVIVTYECAPFLRRCLSSLEAQRDSIRIEVIVIDNASGDDTPSIAHEYPSVRMLTCDGNSGFARAANQGLDRAHGEFVLVLNPDTTIPQGALRACVDAMRADASIGVLTPRIVDEHGFTDLRCHRSFPTAWSAFCFLTGLDRSLPPGLASSYLRRDLADAEPADVHAVSGAFMLMRRNALKRVGGFDQQFFMFAEDIDLCMRFRAAGYRVRYWPGVTVTHAGGGSTRGTSPWHSSTAAAYRTMAPLIRKHRPGGRGVMLAVLAAVSGEILLAWRRLRATTVSAR